MKVLLELQNDLHCQLMKVRNFHYLITSDLFLLAWGQANARSRLKVCKLIKTGTPENVRVWIHERTEEDIELMGVRALRALASQLGIRRYSHMDKVELLNAISAKTAPIEDDTSSFKGKGPPRAN